MTRTTRIQVGDLQAEILGDAHLGRTFTTGVALHKRGLRERLVLRDFETSLGLSTEVKLHINMGDLFDKWAVPFGIIFDAATTYLHFARLNPGCEFIVLAGNHDVARDLEKKGALDLFELIVAQAPNIRVVRHEALFLDRGGERLGFFPFHSTKAADELVTEDCTLAFGHWDTVFGHDNMIPTEKLAAAGCRTAYTGHVHKPDSFARDGVEVVQVGSLQPYAHGEDYGELYVTLTPAELEGKDLARRCVRLLLEPGEVFDGEVDCLQLTFKRASAAEEDVGDVSLGDFNMATLFAQAFEEAGVPEHVRTALMSRFEEAKCTQ